MEHQTLLYVEKAIGVESKVVTQSEKKNMPLVRKSIVAKTKIEKGEAFTQENITVKRPGTGISPMEWDSVIGKKARCAFLPDELIEI